MICRPASGLSLVLNEPLKIEPLNVPVVFASAPSLKAIQAAGIVTSYFGMASDNQPVRFPVHISGRRDFRGFA